MLPSGCFLVIEMEKIEKLEIFLSVFIFVLKYLVSGPQGKINVLQELQIQSQLANVTRTEKHILFFEINQTINHDSWAKSP